jgi:hypothetical protein
VATTPVDSYGCAYDHNSNRLYHENLLQSSLSELYHANGATAKRSEAVSASPLGLCLSCGGLAQTAGGITDVG